LRCLTETSTEQNPTHVFAVEGIYEVELTVSNSAGFTDALQEFRVSATAEPPEASFSYSPSDPAFYCYGSVLDNTSSDPTTITPVLQ